MRQLYTKWRGFTSLLLLLMICQTAFAQQDKTINGRVTGGKESMPLIGASVLVKGTTNGVMTDADGRFSIKVPANGVLTVAYVGYTSKEIPVSSITSNYIDINLTDNAQVLDNVVVVGYGVQKKSDVSGAIVSIKPEEMNAVPTTSVAEMLRGRASGVQVTTETSRPGAQSNVLIRGQRSLSGGNGPLYVVDGIPVNNVNDINAADIESVEVLKDASSQAIYGARAANGVILITTKRGISGKVKLNYNGYAGIQQAKRNFELYNGAEWAALRREAFRTDNNDNYVSDDAAFDDDMRAVMASGQAVDWIDFMLRDAAIQKHDLSLRGGSDMTKVAASLSYFDQNGIVEGSQFKRGTFRLNIDQKISKRINIGSNFSFTKSYQTVEDGDFNSYLTTSPLSRPYNNNGELQLDVNTEQRNPKFLNQQVLDETNTERLLVNLFASVNLLPGLDYRINTSFNSRNSENGYYRTRFYEKGSNIGNRASISTGSYNDYLIENILTYDKQLNENHRFDVTLVQSAYKEESNSLTQSGTQLPNDLLGYNGLPTAVTLNAPGRSLTDRGLLSYMGRVRYSLLNKYLFTFTSRIDGSTVFGANNKYGVFPSAAFAWKIEEEDFMKSVDWVTQLKLRASYGAVGNQAISPYTTLGTVNEYQMLFGDGTLQTGYLATSQLSNPNLKWETTNSLSFGLDFSMFNGKLSGAIDYYKTNTRDLLVRKSINQSLGFSTMLDNLGEVENKGIEVLLNTTPVRTNDFTWGVDLTFTANRNKILKINGAVDAEGKPVNDLNNNWFIGQPIRVHYNYVFDGIWQETDNITDSHMPQAQPGDIRVKDLNNDGQIDGADRQVVYRDPKWYGSVGNTLRYKGFDLFVDFYLVQGGMRNNPYLYDYNSGGSLSGKTNGVKVNYWTPENPSNEFPRPRYSGTINYFSSLGYEDASYIRMRTATIGYTLPAALTRRAGIEQLRVYGTATNIFTRSSFSSFSPEVTPGGYPEPTVMTFGVNVSL